MFWKKIFGCWEIWKKKLSLNFFKKKKFFPPFEVFENEKKITDIRDFLGKVGRSPKFQLCR